ncbi:MAG: hypothetical protein KBT87_04940 [Gammaproteobacteria bacterium]|jgi:hypothetical protein|nr:hypothetical protein [Gammaproteobacteria bacterium]MBQ0774000.1 hypothetical protein [Gammaproteobacteria bacterium]|tara:strand:+ start:39769 stop:40233 length:465 start_codon:yes stop_codon:yes gene_type:complete
MSPLKATLLRTALLLSLGLIALALICTITVIGIISLLSALGAAAAVYIGNAGATLLVAVICLTPALLAVIAIIRLYRHAEKSVNDSANKGEAGSSTNNAIINLIKGNPWEAASLAFLFGFTYRSDPELRALIMHEGLDKLKAAPLSSRKDADNE